MKTSSSHSPDDRRKLRLHINSFRAIKDADIQLNGITVVTGENGSGKSTVSRLLYRILDCSVHFDRYVTKDLDAWLSSLILKLRGFLFDISALSSAQEGRDFRDFRMEGKSLKDKIEFGITCLDNLREFFRDRYTTSQAPFFIRTSLFLDDFLKSFPVTSLQAPEADKFLLTDGSSMLPLMDAMENLLKQIPTTKQNLIDERNIYYLEKYLSTFFPEKKIDFELYDGDVLVNNNHRQRLLTIPDIEEVVYSDTPMSIGLDGAADYSLPPSLEHWIDLNRKLKRDTFSVDNKEKGEKILADFSAVIHGAITHKKRDNFTNSPFEFQRNDGNSFDLMECATGLKSFGLLLLLLKNGVLSNKTMVIIDEPEAHLHPQWIVEYSRLIVRLNKDMGVRFFIVSHNPDMVSAVRYIAEREEILPRVSFYLAELLTADNEENLNFVYRFKSLGNRIDEIFKSFNIAMERIAHYGVQDDDDEI